MTVYTVLCMIFFLVIYDSCFIELSRYYLGPTFKKEEKKKERTFFPSSLFLSYLFELEHTIIWRKS